MVALGELLRQESLRQMEMAVSKRSSLSRKKVLRRRRTSDRGGSKRPSVADHPHGSSSKQVTPVKRVPFRGMFLTLLVSYNANANSSSFSLHLLLYVISKLPVSSPSSFLGCRT